MTNSPSFSISSSVLQLGSGSQAIFEILFDTHSIELNYDVEKITQLTDDAGNAYKPVSWTGGKGGHHVEGVLTFSILSPEAQFVTLTIPQVDGYDRIFTWDLKQ